MNYKSELFNKIEIRSDLPMPLKNSSETIKSIFKFQGSILWAFFFALFTFAEGCVKSILRFKETNNYATVKLHVKSTLKDIKMINVG